MADDNYTYPLPAFHFSVSFGDKDLAFSEVSGLNMEVQVIEYRDGLSPAYGAKKMSGLPKVNNVTLKRGVVPSDNSFFEWLNSANLNKPDRKTVTINLLNEDHQPVMTWKLSNAWPVKVESPGLKADGNEVAIETLELAYEVLEIANGQ